MRGLLEVVLGGAGWVGGAWRLQLRQNLVSAGDSHVDDLINRDDGPLTEPKVVHGLLERWCPWRK